MEIVVVLEGAVVLLVTKVQVVQTLVVVLEHLEKVILVVKQYNQTYLFKTANMKTELKLNN